MASFAKGKILKNILTKRMGIGKKSNRWRQPGLWLALCCMGGAAMLSARPVGSVPLPSGEFVAADDSTEKADWLYESWLEEPNIYDVKVNAAGVVLFSSVYDNEFITPDSLFLLSDFMCKSLVKGYDQLRKQVMEEGKPLTVRIIYDDGLRYPAKGRKRLICKPLSMLSVKASVKPLLRCRKRWRRY